MKLSGIICEYNPLHLGHQKQLSTLREHDPEGGIVCLMSGNFVQRGAPAIFDKSLRAEAAVRCGADLVLELPVTASLSSAEGFASEGVRILSGFCDRLCFGAETGTAATLLDGARRLLSPEFSKALRLQLDLGLSFPAARQAAMGSDLLSRPNDILGIEYCKAILTQKSPLTPLVIRREGSYHDDLPDPENPSATAIRKCIRDDEGWLDYVPEEARAILENAPIHTLENGERAMLAILRTRTESEFEATAHGSEGLWRKLMHEVQIQTSVEALQTAVKSKRYTRTRVDRLTMCAFLGITQEQLDQPAPYIRVLALNDRGREILKKARESGRFPNAGERQEDAYQALEDRCGALYGLFSRGIPEQADAEANRRLLYVK